MKVKSKSEVTQLCPTPSGPMDCSPPGSPVPGILQARGLEWGAIAFSDTMSGTFYVMWSSSLTDFSLSSSGLSLLSEYTYLICFHLFLDHLCSVISAVKVLMDKLLSGLNLKMFCV